MHVEQAEKSRLAEEERGEKNWKRWGSYPSERPWETVREDDSADTRCREHAPHDRAADSGDARSALVRRERPEAAP